MVIKKVPLAKVKESEWQARDKSTVREVVRGHEKHVPVGTGFVADNDPLVKAIKAMDGFTQLPTLRQLANGEYEIVNGHIRIAAFRKAFPEATEIQADVVEDIDRYDDRKTALAVALDNGLRKDLTVAEEAETNRKLKEILGTWEKVAEARHMSLATVLRHNALAKKIPESVQVFGLVDSQLRALYLKCGGKEPEMLRWAREIAEKRVAATEIGRYIADRKGKPITAGEEKAAREMFAKTGKDAAQVEADLALWRAGEAAARQVAASKTADSTAYKTEEDVEQEKENAKAKALLEAAADAWTGRDGAQVAILDTNQKRDGRKFATDLLSKLDAEWLEGYAEWLREPFDEPHQLNIGKVAQAVGRTPTDAELAQLEAAFREGSERFIGMMSTARTVSAGIVSRLTGREPDAGAVSEADAKDCLSGLNHSGMPGVVAKAAARLSVPERNRQAALDFAAAALKEWKAAGKVGAQEADESNDDTEPDEGGDASQMYCVACQRPIDEEDLNDGWQCPLCGMNAYTGEATADDVEQDEDDAA